MNLINLEFANRLSKIAFAYSHGGEAKNGYIGGGLFYYALTYSFKFKHAVVLGSGSGYVPIMIRQAQRDLGMEESTTTLIDANLGSNLYGWPTYHDKETYFTKNYPEVAIVQATSVEAFQRTEGTKAFIDYMHIDANHSYESVKEDFGLWRHRIRKGGFISLHDSLFVSEHFGVDKFVAELEQEAVHGGQFEIMTFPFGDGTTLIRFK